ncbi:MAG: UDP-N-acetylglucosamine 2-epimerase (non-hydrolyzing), partial [Candidatus Omnitrophica bacterium]|nr:UDP-N-acetylglucosamine 2-epimerase (non-hydrolyzing) [Candidatus Omnitrophota bacterium]
MKKENRIKKIMVVFGTRPEVIKLAPVIKELQKYTKIFSVFTCTTAQHRQMLDDMLNLFKIKPHCDLNIMRENQSIFEVTTKCLKGIERILKKERPDIVLVQGDTTTTFATSLASFYLKIPVGHIEAGLRTNDKYKPFPEEINRRLTSHIADLHFVPTKEAKKNLLDENISENAIFLTGNTVVDALFYILKEIKNKKILDKDFSFLNLNLNRLILVTAHRRENFGKPLRNICYA